ncbi:hypothetical protein [Candidatus Laterigemmans baculatus]|uniref:hypothetical protein n=1 Tax=Candidatus Laterigemmans baculatus TaxID=2770505 RepID=UPI0013DB1BC6|nr:hypothetical protein [Candidatus Laterigemmans baculatus]
MNQTTLSEPPLASPARAARGPLRRREATGMGLGCLFVIASTALTCLLLFINGGLVQAAYAMLAPTGPDFLSEPRVTQFVMFVGPVLLVVVEWVMIDYLLARLRRPS